MTFSTLEHQPVPEDIAFPVGVAWGAATIAYQIEEGWNADGKGPNVWDTFTHQGGDRVFKNQTGDVACGSYTLWEEDLKCIKQLGLTHYCFSLSWSRLLPDGTTGFINQKVFSKVNYYSKINNNLASCSLKSKSNFCFLSFNLDKFFRTTFIYDEYPAIVKSDIPAKHSKQNYLSTSLPEFTKEEKIIMGTADFYALNFYGCLLCHGVCTDFCVVSRNGSQDRFTAISWPVKGSKNPDTYNNPIIYITENGFSQSDPALLDGSQLWEYFRLILQQILKALNQKFSNAKL
ncbi:cytosolic beta-glucosidase-like [Ara ararauna]